MLVVTDRGWVLDWGEPSRPVVTCSAPATLEGGQPLDVTSSVTSPFGAAQEHRVVTRVLRDWPTAVRSSDSGIPAHTTRTATASFPVPDSAGGTVSIVVEAEAFRVPVRGEPCTCRVEVTSRQLGSLTATALLVDGVVSLSWSTADSAYALARVERAQDGGAWELLGEVDPTAEGAAYLDSTAVAGHTYAYRLAIDWGGQVLYAGLVSVAMPEPPPASLRLAGFRPNPSERTPTVSFQLPRRGTARIEIFDLTGRRVWFESTAMLESGPRVWRLQARLEPGLYLIRLQAGGQSVTARGVVL